MQRREKGTGTIVQRESGTWSGRVSVGRGDDGKIKYKYFSGKTEAEVKKKIREYNKCGCQQEAPQILFKDYLMNWLTNVKKISLKPSSYDRLESTALKQVIPRIGTFKISEITVLFSIVTSAPTSQCTITWNFPPLPRDRRKFCVIDSI